MGTRLPGRDRGIGYIPMHLVKMNVEKERERHEAPFYVLVLGD